MIETCVTLQNGVGMCSNVGTLFFYVQVFIVSASPSLDRSELFICTKLNVARSPMSCADGMLLFLMTILCTDLQNVCS